MAAVVRHAGGAADVLLLSRRDPGRSRTRRTSPGAAWRRAPRSTRISTRCGGGDPAVPSTGVSGQELVRDLRRDVPPRGWFHRRQHAVPLDLRQQRRGPATAVVYPLFYVLGGLAASALQLVFGADSTIPNLGASGAIGGILGAYVVLFPHARVLTLIIFFITWVEIRRRRPGDLVRDPTVQRRGRARGRMWAGWRTGRTSGVRVRRARGLAVLPPSPWARGDGVWRRTGPRSPRHMMSFSISFGWTPVRSCSRRGSGLGCRSASWPGDRGYLRRRSHASSVTSCRPERRRSIASCEPVTGTSGWSCEPGAGLDRSLIRDKLRSRPPSVGRLAVREWEKTRAFDRAAADERACSTR